MFARLQRLRPLAPALALVVAVAAAVWLVKAWPKWQSARLADAWREDLESADAARIPAIVENLVDLGDAGLESIIAALASPRDEVRAHATAAIRRLVDNWEVSDISARSVAAGQLSALFARHIADFAHEQRQAAATLVQQMLAWKVDAEFVDRTQLILDCESVLLAADAAAEDADRSAAAAAARLTAPPPVVDRDLASLARLPGGGLSVEPSQPPRLPQLAEPLPPSSAGDPREPRLLLDGRGDELPPAPFPVVHPEDAGIVNPSSATTDGKNPQVRTNNVLRGGGAANAGPHAARSHNAADNAADGAAGHVADQHADEDDAPSPSTQSTIPLGPATPREMSLVRLLQSEPSIAAEAQRQLRAIGYGDREIVLAHGVSDPNVDQRLRFVESLPRAGGVRPRRWLEIMLDDDDPRVRLAAMVQLATSGDAALLESLRRRALADSDPTVRQQAERLRPTQSR